MKIISVASNNHDSAITLIEDGKIVNHINCERISRTKYDSYVNFSFQKLLNISGKIFDHLSFIIFREKTSKDTNEILTNEFISPKFISSTFLDHHLSHAYCGFYFSKFDDALCFIFDGDGSEIFDLFPNMICNEKESVFLFKDGKCDNSPMYGEYKIIGFDSNFTDIILDDNKLITKDLSIGNKYENLSVDCGFHWNDAGKLMGLAQYKFNKNKLPQEYNNDFWRKKVDEAYELQLESKNKIASLIRKFYQKTGIKNIIISGGVGLNCVINYQLLKEFPELNFHIDPICSDNGISIGNAFYQYIKETRKNPERLTHTYLGLMKYDYNLSGLNHKKVTYDDIANLLVSGNLIAIFQGRSEIGKRSLGNRSLLFDPRVKNGQDIVNELKKREKFRPFAASILLENVNNWFDLRTLKESPYMSFAIDAKNNAVEKVPAVIHADNTSRIQTVTEKQNYHFYNLIKKFYEKTNVPMLLNTSFNLAGFPIVESFDDAIDVLYKSDIEYLYLPEIETLITIKNNN